jgi:hypothetical protein
MFMGKLSRILACAIAVTAPSSATVMAYSGIDVQAGHRFVVTGRAILGRRSVFSLIVTEPSARYPAEETRRVLGSIRR